MVEISDQIFLAGDVSSEFPWYNFSIYFLVEKLFDKVVGGRVFSSDIFSERFLFKDFLVGIFCSNSLW